MPSSQSNKIKYGLRNVYYAVITGETNGKPTYDAPMPIPGAVNLSLSAEVEDNPFYADDVVYFRTIGNNGYSGTLEIALIPDDFRTNVLLEEQNSGVFVENAAAIPKEFALLFEFQGDVYATRRLFYRFTVSRPDVNAATKEESIEPQTETLNLVVMPRIDNQDVKASCPATVGGVYSAWYDSVWEKASNPST